MTVPEHFDELVHAPTRLQICAMLAPVESIEFSAVRDGLGVADSVLSKHIRALSEAGYVTVHKAAFLSRVRTSFSLTPSGRRAYQGHLAALRAIMDTATPGPEAVLQRQPKRQPRRQTAVHPPSTTRVWPVT
jgi:DNA-binding MarR family transcriptional regulator